MGKTEYGKNLDIASKKKVLDNLIKAGYSNLVLSTKEPLYSDDFIEFLKYCRRSNVIVSIATNGTLISEAFTEELFKGYVDYLAISLEGLSPDTNDYVRGKGSYEKTISGIKAIKRNNEDLQKKYIPIILQINITPLNVKEIIDCLNSFVDDYSIYEVVIGGIIRYGNAKDNDEITLQYSEYVKILRKIAEHFSKTDLKSKLKFKDLMPYDMILINLSYGYSFEHKVPYCRICEGKSFSIMPDGTLCRCSLLLNTGIISNDDLIIKHNASSGLKNIQIENITSKYVIKKDGYCKKCKFKEECNICYLYTTNYCVNKEIVTACEQSHRRYEKIINSILGGKIKFKLNASVVIQDLDSGIQLTSLK